MLLEMYVGTVMWSHGLSCIFKQSEKLENDKFLRIYTHIVYLRI